MANSLDLLQQKGITLRHLRLLAGLAQAGQVGLAAGRLGMSQPAASRLLAEVEAIAGAPVHSRTGRGILLTPLGEALARRAERIQMELRSAARDMEEIASGGAGHVRIGSVTGPALELVLPALRASRAAQPMVTAEVIVAPSDVLVEQVLTGRIDFAIGRLPKGPDGARLDARVLGAEPVSLVVRRGHPLVGQSAIAASLLLDYDWVMPGPESLLARTVASRLAALGLPHPRQHLSTASFLLTLAMLDQSDAIAPLARAVAAQFARAPGAAYAELALDLGIEVEPFALISPAGLTLPPAARRLADRILA